MRRRREKASRVLIFDIRKDDDAAYRRSFLDSYVEFLERVVDRAEESLVVLDYLAHHRQLNAAQHTDFAARNADYFSHISHRVKAKNLKYTRIIQLPLELQSASRRSNDTEALLMAMALMYRATLRHIVDMSVLGESVEIYVISAPLRPYSLMIADRSAIVTEYDRYSRRGVSVPDHLFMDLAEQQGDAGFQLIQAQLDCISKIKGANRPISPERLKLAAQQLGKYREKVIHRIGELSGEYVGEGGLLPASPWTPELSVPLDQRFFSRLGFDSLNLDEAIAIERDFSKKLEYLDSHVYAGHSAR